MTAFHRSLSGPAKLNILYTNIGRGHPFYLDGVIEALIRIKSIGLVRNETDVFELSHGKAALSWKLVKWMYRHGSSQGMIGYLYNRLRKNRDYNKQSVMLSIMGRDIREKFADDDNPLIVAHPSLVGILQGKQNLLYQHGELVAPNESLVTGATTVFVPTDAVAEEFVKIGYTRSNIVVTGLCIEPALKQQARDAFAERIERLQSENMLTGFFCSSGAEPKPHVEKLVASAVSAVLHGSRVIVLAKKGGTLSAWVIKAMIKQGIPFKVVDSSDYLPVDFPPAIIVRYSTRREENWLVAHLFPVFDYIVAPSHERTNWGVGLGLPYFILGPSIGPFAPRNRDLLMASGVAESIETHVDAHLFGQHVRRLWETGKLLRMAGAGWDRYSISGFKKIAEFLVNKYSNKSYHPS